MSASYDWSRFVVRINVRDSIERLYHAWATRRGMEHWFLRLSEYKKPDDAERSADELVQKGDTYKWLWYGWADDTVEYGRILYCYGKDLFKFSFVKAGYCTVSIYAQDGETIVELMQQNIPPDEQGKHYRH